MLDRDEYIEQAHFFHVLSERLPQNIALQELLAQVRDEVLATTSLSSMTKVYVPSPLVIDDKLLVISDDGRGLCYEADSGDVAWRKRIGGDCSASPVMAGDHVYVPDEGGTIFVFRATPEFELVAENELSSGGFATPAICGGRIFIKTRSALYCVGHKSAE